MRVLFHRDTAVTLFSDSGECWAYDSRAAALRDLGASFIRRQVGPQFRSSRFYAGPDGYTRHDVKLASYVMRDDHGNALGLEDFADLLPPVDPLYRHRWARWAVRQWNGDGPVPGTGRHGSYHFHRHPHTMAERRANLFADQEVGEPRARAKRSSRSLPNAWDDLPRHLIERNWKAYRSTQYKRVVDLGMADGSTGAPDDGDDDPTLLAFLDLLERDLAAHPERCVPLSRERFEQVQALVRDVTVDLDARLSEHEDAG